MKNISLRLCTDVSLCLDQGVFGNLGITFNVDLTAMVNLNYENKFREIKDLIIHWKKRYLTPYGKITVIKSFVRAKLNHLVLTLPHPSDKYIQQLQQLFCDFLWDSKRDKIKRKVIFKTI